MVHADGNVAMHEAHALFWKHCTGAAWKMMQHIVDIAFESKERTYFFRMNEPVRGHTRGCPRGGICRPGLVFLQGEMRGHRPCFSQGAVR